MPIETQRGYRVTLTFGQRKVLNMLADRGGSADMDLTNLSREAKDGVADLQVKGLITVVKLVGTPQSQYKLTDLGVQVVDMIKATAQIS